jgi:non-canonical purine NTP pyrophosphatase (RdgB/HAM1 family)
MIHSRNFEILVATRNRGKILEIQEALSTLPVKLRYLEEFVGVSTVDEVGRTYEENAVLKALGYSRQTGVCALADDSGLEVDALGGMPGVFSARYGGEHASDDQRIQKLLMLLSISDQGRTARFVCCMALAGLDPKEGQVGREKPQLLKVTEAKCEGVIATTVRGANGFGYDPVFVPAGYDATFAELPSAVKSAISHRALALAAMRKFLDHWLA